MDGFPSTIGRPYPLHGGDAAIRPTIFGLLCWPSAQHVSAAAKKLPAEAGIRYGCAPRKAALSSGCEAHAATVPARSNGSRHAIGMFPERAPPRSATRLHDPGPGLAPSGPCLTGSHRPAPSRRANTSSPCGPSANTWATVHGVDRGAQRPDPHGQRPPVPTLPAPRPDTGDPGAAGLVGMARRG